MPCDLHCCPKHKGNTTQVTTNKPNNVKFHRKSTVTKHHKNEIDQEIFYL